MMTKVSREVHPVDSEVSAPAEVVALETALTASSQGTCPRIALNQKGKEHSVADSEEVEEAPETAAT